MKNFKRFLTFLTLILLLVGCGYFSVVYYLENKYPELRAEELDAKVEFEIRRGTGLYAIIDVLYEKNLIESKFLFYLYCYHNNLLDKFKSGDYSFLPGVTRKELTFRLLNGAVKQHKITVVEGMTMQEIAVMLGEKTSFSPEKFLAICRKGDEFSYRNARGTLEGYLFPDTYFFDRTTDERKLVERMVGHFGTKIEALKKELNLKEIKDLDKIITMASIIEKESSNLKEKPLVASVFYNRLRKNYLLQTDPTVIYAVNLVREFNGNLTRKDLKMDSEYNTYRKRGLPPTAIANPGIESIRAAILPATTDYLYFVSMKNGQHYFSKSLAEHNRAVRKYQLNR